MGVGGFVGRAHEGPPPRADSLRARWARCGAPGRRTAQGERGQACKGSPTHAAGCAGAQGVCSNAAWACGERSGVCAVLTGPCQGCWRVRPRWKEAFSIFYATSRATQHISAAARRVASATVPCDRRPCGEAGEVPRCQGKCHMAAPLMAATSTCARNARAHTPTLSCACCRRAAWRRGAGGSGARRNRRPPR